MASLDSRKYFLSSSAKWLYMSIRMTNVMPMYMALSALQGECQMVREKASSFVFGKKRLQAAEMTHHLTMNLIPASPARFHMMSR